MVAKGMENQNAEGTQPSTAPKPGRSGGLGGEGRTARFFLLFLLVFGVGMIFISLFGDQGWFAYSSLKAEKGTLTEKLAELEARREALSLEIKALKTDRGYIEFKARQQLGLVYPDELILQLPRTEKP